MALITVPVVLTASAAAVALGYFADKTGEGANDAGSGLIKTAVAALIVLYIYKQVK